MRRSSAALVVAVAAILAGIVASTVLDAMAAMRRQHILQADLEAASQDLLPAAAQLFRVPSAQADEVVRQWAAAGGHRITLINPDGTLHADTSKVPDVLDYLQNHATRPEVLAARAGGPGVAERVSATTGRRTFYVARAVGPPGSPTGYLRVAEALRPAALPWAPLFVTLVAALAGAGAAEVHQRRRHREVARHLRAWTDLPEDAELGALAEDADRTVRAAREASQRELDALRAAASEVSVGMILVGHGGRVRYANEAAGRLLGPGLATGQPLVEAVRAPELLQAVAAAAGGAETHTTFSTGDTTELVARACPLSHPLLAVAVVLRDVGDERRLERARRALVADLAHELRTPLTVLQGLVEELGDTGKEPELGEVLGRQVRRLRAFAEELEELAAIEAGQVIIHPEPTNVASVVRQVVRDMAPQAETAGIALSSAGDDVEIVTDPVRLAQVVTNLVANGVRFNNPEGRVSVSTRALEDAVEVAVEDDGIGIPVRDVPLVFQRFYRVRRDGRQGGSGLGLAIVKHLVHALGGTVRLSSREGVGTTVTVTLPR